MSDIVGYTRITQGSLKGSYAVHRSFTILATIIALAMAGCSSRFTPVTVGTPQPSASPLTPAATAQSKAVVIRVGPLESEYLAFPLSPSTLFNRDHALYQKAGEYLYNQLPTDWQCTENCDLSDFVQSGAQHSLSQERDLFFGQVIAPPDSEGITHPHNPKLNVVAMIPEKFLDGTQIYLEPIPELSHVTASKIQATITAALADFSKNTGISCTLTGKQEIADITLSITSKSLSEDEAKDESSNHTAGQTTLFEFVPTEHLLLGMIVKPNSRPHIEISWNVFTPSAEHLLEPLFRDNLDEYIAFVLQYTFSRVVQHEVIHAIGVRSHSTHYLSTMYSGLNLSRSFGVRPDADESGRHFTPNNLDLIQGSPKDPAIAALKAYKQAYDYLSHPEIRAAEEAEAEKSEATSSPTPTWAGLFTPASPSPSSR